MIIEFAKLYRVEVNTEKGVICKQVLFINRGDVIEIITSSFDNTMISTVSPNNVMDDASSLFDAINSDSAIAIASIWGVKTVDEIKAEINKTQEDLIEFEAVGIH